MYVTVVKSCSFSVPIFVEFVDLETYSRLNVNDLITYNGP